MDPYVALRERHRADMAQLRHEQREDARRREAAAVEMDKRLEEALALQNQRTARERGV